MKINHLLLVLAGLVPALISATPTPQLLTKDLDVPVTNSSIDDPLALGYDPSFSYHSQATVETWIGRSPVSVGDVTGSALYGTVWQLLFNYCIKHDGWCATDNWRTVSFNTHYLDKQGKIIDSVTGIRIERGAFQSHEKLKIMVGIIAGALEAATLNGSNCYDVVTPGGTARYCNVGDIIRVNMPANHLHVRLHNAHGTSPNGHADRGQHLCCQTRWLVDRAIDKLGLEIYRLWGGYSRVVRCLIDGWTTCEECGAKCG